MKLLNVRGRLVSKNVSKYLIDWDKPSKSKLQFATKQFLKPYWFPYIVYEEFPCIGSLLKVDFVNMSLKIAIEVHGQQHGEYHFFHNNSPNAYLSSIRRDVEKAEWLELNKFKFIEINYDEVPLLSRQFFLDKFEVKL